MFAVTLFLTASLLFQKIVPSLDHANICAYAVHIETGEVLIDEKSDKSMVPASCMKLVTTGAALHLLGPESRFQTDLQYDGKIDREGCLRGNLYIRGGGDPSLGSDQIPSSLSIEKQVEEWVQAVKKLGIKRIDGEVIADATKWEKARAVPSWTWEDVGNYYGAGACALSFHENYYTLVFKPADMPGGSAAILRTEPVIPMLAIHNEVTTGPVGSGDRACIYGSEFSSVQQVRGTVPAGVAEFSIKGLIPDPALFCAQTLAQALTAQGIAIGHAFFSEQNKRVLFHTTFSPTIKEIVYWTNQKSINLYAEHLLKKMGEIVHQEGSTLAGTKALTAFWKSKKVDLAGCNIMDGSGLSRQNLFTAKQLVAILLSMKKSEHFQDFFQSLPKKSDHVSAKSGTMAQVKAYAGYAKDIAFAIIINHHLHPQVSEKLELFLSELHNQ